MTNPYKNGLPPGSPEAQMMGCNCPVIDNHYGQGYWGNGEKYGWMHRGDCPIHGEPPPEQVENPEPYNEKE